MKSPKEMSTQEKAAEFAKKFGSEPGTTKILFDLQEQLIEVFTDRARKGAFKEFSDHVFDTSETFTAVMLSIAVYAGQRSKADDKSIPIKSNAIDLLAGFMKGLAFTLDTIGDKEVISSLDDIFARAIVRAAVRTIEKRS